MRALKLIGLVSLIALLVSCADRPGASTESDPEQSVTQTAAESANVPDAPSSDEQWDRFVSGFIHGWFERNPTHAVYAGKHEYDGQLPDFSPAGLARYLDWLKAQKQTIEDFTDADLSETNAFQAAYLEAVVDEAIFWIDEADWPSKNPMWYAGSLSPSVYATRAYAPLAERLQAYIDYANNLPQALAQMRANLETPLPLTYIETAQKMTAGLAQYFAGSIPEIFAAAINDTNRAAFERANAGAIEAAKQTAAWFEGLRDSATDDYAMGPELYAAMLEATERVDLPLDRLREIAQADLARNLEALDAACAQFAPDASLEDCVAKVKANKPEGGPVEAATRTLADLRRFVQTQNIAAIPGTEEARVAESPPYRRSNFAYIEIPGPFEEGLPSTYYIAPPDPEWSEAVQQAYLPGKTQLLFVTIHEVWPGHFLQFLHAQKAEGLIGQLFVGYAFAEGWAHYTEEMMFDAGVRGATPEVHIGQLLNALLRNVRFISSLGLHTGDMSVEESIQLFLTKGFQDPGNARQQAARGTYDPGYLNYTLGKLMIMTLREDWIAERGGREAWNEFHNEFLSYGGPPIPLVREAMLGADDHGALIEVPSESHDPL